MKNIFIHQRTLVAALFLFTSFTNFAQKTSTNTSVYFNSGKSTLTSSARQTLDAFLTQIELGEGCKLRIYGYTDSDGTDESNLILSQNRSNQVMAYIIEKGTKNSDVEIAAFGETKPIDENNTEQGKKANRRVDIYVDCRMQQTPSPSSNSTSQTEIKKEHDKHSLDTLFMLLAGSPQKFEIDPKISNVVECSGGSKLYFPANAFQLSSEDQGKKVTVQVTEVFNKNEMILQNMSTNAGNAILESGGMLDVKAFVGDKEVSLSKRSSFASFIPTEDPNVNMSLFDGKHLNNSQHSTHWKERSDNNFQSFAIPDILNCSRYIPSTVKCGFRCRMKMKLSKRYRKFMKISMRDKRNRNCKTKKELMTEMGISNEDDLMKALWNAEFKKYGVSNFDEYQKVKWETQQDQQQLSMYAFSGTNLGMVNCDYFAKFPEQMLTTMEVANDDGKPTYMTLAFHTRNILLGANDGFKKYSWNRIPEGQKVTIVALRYENQKIYAAFKTTHVQQYAGELEYHEISIEELKEKLKHLDDMEETVSR